MRKNKKTSIPMKLFVWFLTVTMMCTNISIPAFAEEFSAGEFLADEFVTEEFAADVSEVDVDTESNEGVSSEVSTEGIFEDGSDFTDEFSAGEPEEIVMFSDGDSAEEVETPSETPAAEDAEVFLTLSVKGTPAQAKDGSAMLNRSVIVKDIDGDGTLTYDEALKAAHDAYYEGGAEAGYGSENTEFGLSLTKLWGDTSGAFGYWKNDGSCWSLGDAVADGDYLNAFVYKDAAGYSDAYIRFDYNSYMTLTEVVCDVALEKAVWDTEAYAYVFQSCEGAAFSVYDSGRKLVSAEDYTVSEEGILFKKAGTYYLVASGTDSQNFVPAVTKVRASKNVMMELKGITLNYESRTVPAEVDDYTKLTATLEPADLKGVTITWTSSNPEVAKVEDGKVYGLTAGETIITASAGNVKAECKYKVTNPPTLSSVKCYTDANAYKAGKALTMTPEFKENQQTGYTVFAPDYLSQLYVEGTIAEEYVKEGYNTIYFVGTWGNSGYRTDENGVKAYTSQIKGNKTTVFANRVYQYELGVSRYTTLKNLVTDGRMQEAFNRDTNTYRVMVDQAEGNFAVTPTAYSDAYGIKVNGTEVKSGEKCEIPFNWDAEGKMTVLVEVSGNKMESSTYTLELEKTELGTAPVIQSQPKSADYIENDKAEALAVDVISNGTLSYQWYSNTTNSTEGGTAIENAVEASYVPSTEKTGTYYYYCIITNTKAAENNQTVSDVVSVVVDVDPTPVAILGNTGSAMPEDGYEYSWNKGFVYKIGDTTTPLTVTAKTNVEGGELSYAWKRISKAYNQSVSAYAPTGTATEASYTPQAIENNASTTGYYYGCQVTCTFKGKKYTSWATTGETYTVGEGENAETYDVIGVYVFVKADKAATPKFKQQPVGKTYKVGSYISTMYAQAEIADGGKLTYQWYVSDTNDTENGTAIANATKMSYYLGKATTEGTKYYYCIATNTNQGYTASAISDIAEIVVGEKKEDNKNDTEITIDLSGKGTAEDPYRIKTAQDYITVAELVADGNSFAGKYLKQERNITLPKGWKPIGVTIDGTSDIKSGSNLYPFSGILDGNGKTLTIPEGGLPLLGYVKGAEVHNLNIYGKKIAGYGLVNNFVGVGLSGSAIVIDGVTLKSGSSTLKSGLIGTYITTNGYAGCSASFMATIRNCTVEEGVVIGYQKNQSMIGSIAGRFQGNIENCVSYATVYGVDYVGGIVGTRDNSMSGCSVLGSTFNGTVAASGTYAGGIAGGGYCNSTAPNGYKITINNCTVNGNVSGADRVGGLLGGDGFVAQAWNDYTIKGNVFNGKVQATNGTYVGGIIGFYDSLNKKDNIVGNYYSADCGAERGIGFVNYVDTSYANPTAVNGTLYFNTAEGTANCPEVTGCGWKADYNRTDDPLGVHAKKLASTNPKQEPEVITLTVSGDYKTTYYAGEKFDVTGMQMTAEWTNDTVEEVKLEDITIDDSAMSEKGWKNVKLTYQGVTTEVQVRVLSSIKVTFSLLGDSKHESDKDGKVHTLTDGNLETWVPETVYYVSPDATVYDIILKAAQQYDFKVIGDAGNQYGSMYISGITWKGVTLEELDNGPNSGWMDVVNGVHPNVGVDRQTLKNNDVIVFHYTDDYTLEHDHVWSTEWTYDKKAHWHECTYEFNDCNITDNKEKPGYEAHTFDDGKVTKKATCKSTGVKTYTCTVCGGTKTETIPKLAHKYGSWKTVSKATVFKAAVREHTCSVCKKKETKSYGSKLTPVLEIPGKLSSISMKNGKSVTMSVTMANGDSISSAKASSTKTLGVTLNKKTGKITLKALKTGSTKLTIKLASGKSRTYTVKVVSGTVKTTSLSVTNVTNKKLTLAKNKSYTLKTEVKPFTSTQSLKFESSNTKVATVTSKGKITAVAPGKSTITVTSGSKKVQISVTVPGITIAKTSVSVSKNKTLTLSPKVYGISGSVTYKSSDPKVATVTSKGKVKGIKKGTAKITIKAGSYTKTVTVTVK